MSPLEVSSSSEWCQRWSHRQHSWRHMSEPFDPSLYHVEQIGRDLARDYVMAHHYAGTWPSDKFRFGLFENDTLVGVCVLSSPTNNKVLTNPFPGLLPHYESIELGRLVLADRVPANGESWFVTRVFRRAADLGVRGVVSFSDPVARVVDGHVIFPGHVGWIYQALNGVYTGRATPGTLLVLRDGRSMNRRTLSKIRQQERGHRYAESMLVDHGARVMRAGERPAAWLKEALDVVNPTRIRHAGNHRYCFSIGASRRRRQLQPTGPYPKTTD